MKSTLLFSQQTGNGRPLVLLHGWGVNSNIFSPLLEKLSNYSCTAIDLPGFGDSSPIDGGFNAWAKAIADELPPQSILLGWSLGGLLATAIANQYPHKVAALITVASSPFFLAQPEQSWPGIPAPVLQQFEQQLQQDLTKTVERFLALQAMGSESAKEDIRHIRELVLAKPQPHADALAQGLEMLKSVDVRNIANELDCPWLRIWGKLDGLVPRKIVPFLQRENVTDVIINKASHAPFISHSEEFLACFQQWTRQKGLN